jgi:hypothetical protein
MFSFKPWNNWETHPLYFQILINETFVSIENNFEHVVDRNVEVD